MVTRTWISFDSGLFNDPNMWFPAGIPADGDLVSFEVPQTITVTFPGNLLGLSPAAFVTSFLWARVGIVTFSGSAEVDRDNVTYTVDSTTMTEADRGIIIGLLSGDHAELHLRPAGPSGLGLVKFRAAAATIGNAPGSVGTIDVGFGAFEVFGSDSTETELIIGNHGTGTLRIGNGAALNVTGFNSRVTVGNHADGVGEVTVTGAGSTWTNHNELWVGGSGTGSLVIQDGGRLRCASLAGFSNVIGTFPGAGGSVTVDGFGSTWTYGNRLVIGNGGDGTLTVTNGGSVVSSPSVLTQIGSDGTGAVTVTGAGSLWDAGGLQVGSTGTGVLAVRDGGTLTSRGGLLRGLNSGSGQVLVTDLGSAWTVNGSLTIGEPEPLFTTGPTRLTIASGGRVEVAQNIVIDANGVLELHGGTLSADEVSFLANGHVDWSAGTLQVHVFHASLTNQAGTLAPPRVNGGAVIDGFYTQLAGAEMELEIGGTTSGTQYDFLGIDGPAVLDGALRLTLVEGFVPAPVDTFTVLAADGIQGTFKNVGDGQRLNTTDGLGSFVVHYEPADAVGRSHVVLSDFGPAVP